jgi:hypothetical protein
VQDFQLIVFLAIEMLFLYIEMFIFYLEIASVELEQSYLALPASFGTTYFFTKVSLNKCYKGKRRKSCWIVPVKSTFKVGTENFSNLRKAAIIKLMAY